MTRRGRSTSGGEARSENYILARNRFYNLFTRENSGGNHDGFALHIVAYINLGKRKRVARRPTGSAPGQGPLPLPRMSRARRMTSRRFGLAGGHGARAAHDGRPLQRFPIHPALVGVVVLDVYDALAVRLEDDDVSEFASGCEVSDERGNAVVHDADGAQVFFQVALVDLTLVDIVGERGSDEYKVAHVAARMAFRDRSRTILAKHLAPL